MAAGDAPGGPGVPGSIRAALDGVLDRVPLLALVGVVVAALAIGGLVAASARMPGTTAGDIPSGVATPPAGTVWFGAGFDAQTFELTGRSGHEPIGATVAAVARLTRPVTDGEASVEVALNQTTLATMPLHLVGTDPHDVVAWTFALPVAGTFRISVVGPGDALLASGTVIAP